MAVTATFSNDAGALLSVISRFHKWPIFGAQPPPRMGHWRQCDITLYEAPASFQFIMSSILASLDHVKLPHVGEVSSSVEPSADEHLVAVDCGGVEVSRGGYAYGRGSGAVFEVQAHRDPCPVLGLESPEHGCNAE